MDVCITHHNQKFIFASSLTAEVGKVTVSVNHNCDHIFLFQILLLILVQTKTAITLFTTDSSADCNCDHSFYY